LNAQAEPILYLSERDVAAALESIDIVAAVRGALAAHSRGETVLAQEAYLGWEYAGETLRSLSMPGLVDGTAGVKIINANPANPSRGLPRASGLTLLFDVQTSRPTCILAAAGISCRRTAAVTAIAAEILGAHPIERLALIGAGALARCHLHLLPPRLPDLREIRLYDLDASRAAALAATADLIVCESAEQAIRGAQLVVPLTTTRAGYIPYDWLEPGTLLVNVSLDDPLPDVALRADKLYVDDWKLVAADEHRVLGRMLRAGQISPPGSTTHDARAIDGELGELLNAARSGRRHAEEIILVNPFGLAIEDLAVAAHVYNHALEHGLGITLDP
jgi:N-[(2S)-2-amino-2-carboxyethyl]-L-glutamate dehydrogenase